MAKRGPQLNSIADVSAFLAKIIREVYVGKLELALGGRLSYMCNTLKSCLEATDIEKRIAALEEQSDKPS